MKLFDIAFGNLKRRKSKLAYLIVGMALGIATLVSLSTIVSALEMDVMHKLEEFGANIMVVPKSNTLSMSYGGISVPGAHYDVKQITEDEVEKIYSIENKENIATVSPKLLGAIEVGDRTLMLVGADLSAEIKLKKWWKFTNDSNINLVRTQKPSPIHDGYNMTVTVIDGLRENDLILGSEVADTLYVKSGEKLKLKGEEFTVKGILEQTGSQDDSVIFMSLAKAQELTDKKGKITLIEVAAMCAACPAEEIARQINEKIPEGKATPIRQVVEGRMRTIKQLSNFGYTIGLVVLAIASLIVFTTMMSSVRERVREIGIFRAIGFRRKHIVKLIVYEAFILGLIAGVIGYLIGVFGASVIGPWVTDVDFTLSFDPQLALYASLVSVVIGVLATIYPAVSASNIQPSEALRAL